MFWSPERNTYRDLHHSNTRFWLYLHSLASSVCIIESWSIGVWAICYAFRKSAESMASSTFGQIHGNNCFSWDVCESEQMHSSRPVWQTNNSEENDFIARGNFWEGLATFCMRPESWSKCAAIIRKVALTDERGHGACTTRKQCAQKKIHSPLRFAHANICKCQEKSNFLAFTEFLMPFSAFAVANLFHLLNPIVSWWVQTVEMSEMELLKWRKSLKASHEGRRSAERSEGNVGK
jgi:hypothetical protein